MPAGRGVQAFGVSYHVEDPGGPAWPTGARRATRMCPEPERSSVCPALRLRTMGLQVLRARQPIEPKSPPHRAER